MCVSSLPLDFFLPSPPHYENHRLLWKQWCCVGVWLPKRDLEKQREPLMLGVEWLIRQNVWKRWNISTQRLVLYCQWCGMCRWLCFSKLPHLEEISISVGYVLWSARDYRQCQQTNSSSKPHMWQNYTLWRNFVLKSRGKTSLLPL